MQINLSFVILVVASCSAEHHHQLLRRVASSEGLFAKKSDVMGRLKFLKEEEIQTHYIAKGEPKMFVYLLQWEVRCLTITITSCSVPIAWSIRTTNVSGVKVDMSLTGWSPNSFESGTQVYEEQVATPRAYQAAVAASASGYIQILVSIAGCAAELRPAANLTITSRRHKGQLSVRWPPSTVDPHMVSYFLVVNPNGPTSSLCGAKVLAGLDINHQITPGGLPFHSGNLTIENLGSKTSSIIKGMKPDQNYTVEVFIVNNLTGLSYLYGTIQARYTRTRPIPLRDGKQTEANLKKLDGRATFRYKVPKSTPIGGRLEWYVTVCGTGTVLDAEVRHRRKPIIQRKEIVGYSTVSLDNPTPGATYILRLNSTEPEMLARITQVQVMATTRGLQEPVLPKGTSLHEWKSRRGCRSVQLSWVPSSPSPTSDSNFLTYCITTREVLKSDVFTPTADQCAYTLALKNHDYTTNFCFHRPVNIRKVITKEVGHLKPGKFYDMQVAVRHGNSRVLSYQKIRIRTKQHC